MLKSLTCGRGLWSETLLHFGNQICVWHDIWQVKYTNPLANNQESAIIIILTDILTIFKIDINHLDCLSARDLPDDEPHHDHHPHHQLARVRDHKVGHLQNNTSVQLCHGQVIKLLRELWSFGWDLTMNQKRQNPDSGINVFIRSSKKCHIFGKLLPCWSHLYTILEGTPSIG